MCREFIGLSGRLPPEYQRIPQFELPAGRRAFLCDRMRQASRNIPNTTTNSIFTVVHTDLGASSLPAPLDVFIILALPYQPEDIHSRLGQWISPAFPHGFVHRQNVFNRQACLHVVDGIENEPAAGSKNLDSLPDLIANLR